MIPFYNRIRCWFYWSQFGNPCETGHFTENNFYFEIKHWIPHPHSLPPPRWWWGCSRWASWSATCRTPSWGASPRRPPVTSWCPNWRRSSPCPQTTTAGPSPSSTWARFRARLVQPLAHSQNPWFPNGGSRPISGPQGSGFREGHHFVFLRHLFQKDFLMSSSLAPSIWSWVSLKSGWWSPVLMNNLRLAR